MAQLVALREDLAAQIAMMIVSQPKKSYPVIAKEFGGVKPPLVLEPKPGKGPGSKPIVPRPAKPEEIPQ
jgi:hypothetical protein